MGGYFGVCSELTSRVAGTMRAPSLSAQAASEMVDSGQVVALPTETVMGLAASAASSQGMERLWTLIGGGDSAKAHKDPLAWHAPTVERAFEVLGDLQPIHRRLLERLSPGPVMFAVQFEPDRLQAARKRLGALPATVDDGKELLIRIPSHPAAHAFLLATRSPIVMAGLPVLRPWELRDADDAIAALDRLSPGLSGLLGGAIASGPTPLGKASTLVRLKLDGSYEVARVGAYEERFVRKRLQRTILFVCTGNTCRSPMAEAIARDLLKDGPADGIPTEVRSAGVSAYGGAPATPEAVEALAEMGIDMGSHASNGLTRDMLGDADIVFAMTTAHALAAKDVDPGSAGKVKLLDPDGGNVEDPIGQSADVYRETAKTMRSMIESQFKQLGLLKNGAPAKESA